MTGVVFKRFYLLLLLAVCSPPVAYAQGSVHGTAVDGSTGVAGIRVLPTNRTTGREGKPGKTGAGGIFNLVNQEVGEIYMRFNGRGERRVRYFGEAEATVSQQAPLPSRPERVPLSKTRGNPTSSGPSSPLLVRLVKISLSGRRPAGRGAQATSVAGTVSLDDADDDEGYVIKITLTNVDTGKVEESKEVPVKGEQAAAFSFEVKAAADHNLTFIAEDYKPQTLLIVKEEPNQENRFDGAFEIFTAAGEEVENPSSVVVELERLDEEDEEEAEALVSTEEAARRHVFLPKQMESLPVPGLRSFDYFALLAPGVLPPPATFQESGPGVSPGLGTAGQFAVNGLRSRENNFTVDGSDNNDEDIGTRRQGFAALTPQPIESLQEYQIITALADARFGRNIGGQINALTKTGSRGFHGSLYGFFTSNKFNARNFFDQTGDGAPATTVLARGVDGTPVTLDDSPVVLRNPSGGEDALVRWQGGANVGGPFRPLKNTFFFASLERKDISADRESHFAVPTVRQRGFFDSGETGFRLVPRGGGPARPLTPSSIPGDAIFSLYPFPNNPRGPYGPNTYTAVLPAGGEATLVSAKLDKQFGAIDQQTGRPFWSLFSRGDILTGRYNLTQDALTVPVTGGALFSSLRPKVRTQNVAFFLNRTLSARVTDSIRFSFGRTRLRFIEVRDPYLTPSALPDTPFLLNAPLLLNVTAPTPGGGLTPTRYISAAGASGRNFLNSLGYDSVTQAEQITGPLGQVIIPGFSPLGVDTYNFPQERANNTFQIADTIIYTRGRHIATFGFDIRKTQINSTLDRNFRPVAVFNGLPTGIISPDSDFFDRPGGPGFRPDVFTGSTLAAAGAPTGFFQTLSPVPNSTIGIRFTQVNFFFQDEWRPRPNLLFSAGLRYELNTVPDTVGRRVEQGLDPEELRRQAEEAARACNDPVRCGDLVGAIREAFPADFKVSFGSDRNDLDARLGFVANLEEFGGLVVRGGFGSYSGQFTGVVLDQSRNVFPSFLPLNYANFSPRLGGRTYLLNLANPNLQQLDQNFNVLRPGTLNTLAGTNPITLLANRLVSLQNLSLAPTILGLDLFLPQRRLSTPYSLQSALTVEREFRQKYLASAAYVWTRGGKLLRMSTPDGGINNSLLSEVRVSPLTDQSSTPFFQGQLTPQHGDIISKSFTIARTFFNSDATSSYHSLQLEVRKRYQDHFQFGSALTYSHTIDDASDFLDLAGSYALPQSSLPRLTPEAAREAARSERASSNYDVRLRSVTHFVLDLPILHRHHGGRGGGIGSILANLQLAGVMTAQTGQPYTVNTIFDINGDGNLTDRLDNTEGLIYGPVNGDDRVRLSLAPGTDPMSLLPRFLGHNGRVARNTFRAPGVFNFDLSLSSSVTAMGRHTLSYRLEVFNLFNRTHFGIPVRILEHPGFGTSVNTTVPARTLQFAVKYSF